MQLFYQYLKGFYGRLGDPSTSWMSGVASLSPIHAVVSVGETFHPSCLLWLISGPGSTDGRAALLLSICPRAAVAAYHHQIVNVFVHGWMTKCSVKHFRVLWLDKVLYKYRPFTIKQYHQLWPASWALFNPSPENRKTIHNQKLMKTLADPLN